MNLFGWGAPSALGYTSLIPFSQPERIQLKGESQGNQVIRLRCSSKGTVLLSKVGKVRFVGKPQPEFSHDVKARQVQKQKQIIDIPEPVLTMDCGENHFIFLTKSGGLYVYGSNEKGALGMDRSRKRAKRVIKHPGSDKNSRNYFVKVWCFQQCTFLQNSENKLVAAGNNSSGQLGVGSKKGSNVYKFKRVHLPKEVTGVQQVAGGKYHTILLAQTLEGYKLFSCGDNNTDAMGRSSCSVFRPIPTSFLNHKKKEKVIGIACGEWFSMFLTNRGTVYCVGDGSSGAFGNGKNDTITKITRVDLAFKVDRLVCGYDFTIFQSTNGQLFSSGNGSEGCLGINERDSTNVPVKVWFPKPYKMRSTLLISASEYHVACLRSHHDVYTETVGNTRKKTVMKVLRQKFPRSNVYLNQRHAHILHRCDVFIIFVELSTYDHHSISQTKNALGWIENKKKESQKTCPTFLIQHEGSRVSNEASNFVKTLAKSTPFCHYYKMNLSNEKKLAALSTVIRNELKDPVYNLEQNIKLLEENTKDKEIIHQATLPSALDVREKKCHIM